MMKTGLFVLAVMAWWSLSLLFAVWLGARLTNKARAQERAGR